MQLLVPPLCLVHLVDTVSPTPLCVLLTKVDKSELTEMRLLTYKQLQLVMTSNMLDPIEELPVLLGEMENMQRTVQRCLQAVERLPAVRLWAEHYTKSFMS